MRFAIILLALFWAAGAQAANQWGKTCAHSQSDTPATPSNVTSIIGAGEHAGGLPKFACFAWGTVASPTSDVLTVRADSALFCLLPDTAGTATNAVVMVERCPADGSVIPSTANNCLNQLDTGLTGVQGAAGTQNACIRTGPGRYRVVVTTDALTGDFPVVTVEAEE